MIAIDTNVLVRLLVVDDSAQSAAARALVESERVLILRTVLLEAEWVLRSRFALERSLIVRFFEGLAATSGIVLEADASTRRAIGAYRRGVDFADALHATAAGVPFHTFDARLVKQQRHLEGAVVRPIAKRRATR